MNKMIYKYIGPEILHLATKEANYFSVKCSFPKDYNDPYELFLTIDFNQTSELLAFYKESIGNIPQRPTTCFSNSPIITPMWAHYAQNLSGFVVEFNEEKIKKFLTDVSIQDVSYEEKANPQILNMMQQAYMTGKPRHSYFFWNAIEYAAYFTKHTCWNYEQERRLVVDENNIIHKNGHMILNIPIECIESIISGPRTKEDLKNNAHSLASKLSFKYYDMKIGKTNSFPYFLNDNEVYIFQNNQLEKVDYFCTECKEPITDKSTICSWCKIDDKQLEYAASRNPMNLLGQAGMLESYLSTIQNIGKKDS